MLIKKIITGFVIQELDTDKHAFVSQEFIAGDQIDYEDRNGQSVEPSRFIVDGQEAYLPFEMIQPQ